MKFKICPKCKGKIRLACAHNPFTIMGECPCGYRYIFEAKRKICLLEEYKGETTKKTEVGSLSALLNLVFYGFPLGMMYRYERLNNKEWVEYTPEDLKVKAQ